jgi:type I restriction enzyme R subunit
MAYFNEDNVTEQMCIEVAKQAGYEYCSADELREAKNDVIVEPLLQEALIKINHITLSEAQVVIQKVRDTIYKGMGGDIITANQELRNLFFKENSFPFGREGEHVSIRFFETDPVLAPKKNTYVVTNQWEYPRSSYAGGKRLDVVLLINGIPMVIGELKTATKASISWADGAKDILDYQKSIPEMFVPNILSFASEGKELYYGSIGAPLTKWGPWFADEERKHGTLADVQRNLKSLIDPLRLLDIYRFFTVFTTTKDSSKKIKVVCRYQQYYGGMAIVNRVMERTKTGLGPKKGLIWHFQGSGKSWLMVFAAQKLMKMQELNAPTVAIVDDRVDLRDQITGDFTRSEIENVDFAYTGEELKNFFEHDQRKILITTIFLFGKVQQAQNARENIIVLVDEAHRTQERDLGERMRLALPNAFFFGLTGTPINKRDKNTFKCFGADEDTGGYMSKYTFQDSIDDGATLELNFREVPVELHLDEENLQEAFDKMAEDYGLSEEEKDQLTRGTKVEAFFTSPKRIHEVCDHIVKHYRQYVRPTGLKCQVVVYNRACCVAYKKEIDALLAESGDETAIVMHTNGDKGDEYKEYKLTNDQQEKLLNKFRDPLSPLKFVIVTSKLLTGFDAPILQCMYLDKPMKDHTLLQAVCRTNRVYEAQKKCGLIVDYVGVFDNYASSLSFDEETVKTVIKNIKEVKEKIPGFVKDCLDFFPGVDRSIGGFQGLQEAQEKLRDENVKTQFGAHYTRLHKAWEVVSPDEDLLLYKNDYIWLSQVYESIRPVDSKGNLMWTLLGPKTIELIHENVVSIDIGESIEDLVVSDTRLLEECIKDEKKRNRTIIEIEKMLKLRLGNPKHSGSKEFKKISEKLKELQEKLRQKQIDSIQFLKDLLALAKETLEVEQKMEQPQDKRQQARDALTELFESIKTPVTPIVVENVVNDIDTQVVDIVRRFNNAFKTVSGQNEVRKMLRTILWLKYRIKDNDVFEKAYKYVEMYY